MSTYLLPSVVDISGAGKQGKIVINQKRLQHERKNKVLKFSKVPTYLLPSVVDISGAGIKRTVVIHKKDYKTKIKQSTIISNSANIFVSQSGE